MMRQITHSVFCMQMERSKGRINVGKFELDLMHSLGHGTFAEVFAGYDDAVCGGDDGFIVDVDNAVDDVDVDDDDECASATLTSSASTGQRICHQADPPQQALQGVKQEATAV